MTSRPLRLERRLYKVLEVIAESPDRYPAWLVSIRERTGFRRDVIHDALDRMLMSRWIVAEKRAGNSRVCGYHVYRLTHAGWERWEEAIQAELLPSRRQTLLRYLNRGQ